VKKFIMAIIILMLIVTSTLMSLPFNGRGDTLKENFLEDKPLENIEIGNNTELKRFAKIHELEGNGTQENPYVLSGQIIDGKGEQYSLYLSNTDMHFIVRNCEIQNSTRIGVRISQVSNFTMENNEIKDAETGIQLEAARNNSFVSNNIMEGLEIGMQIKEDSPNNTFYDNTFLNNGFILEGDKNTLANQIISTNNTVSGNPIRYITDSREQNIKNENLGQLMIVNSTGVDIEGIEIDLGSVGITLAHSDNITLKDSVIEGQNLKGIHLRENEEIRICSNTIKSNLGYGILIEDSNYNNITNNLIKDSSAYGIRVDEDSAHNHIYLNSFRYNNADRLFYTEKRPSQARDDNYLLQNRWYSEDDLGNHWAPHTGTDENRDGIIDEPYEIEGDSIYDNHPLSSLIGPPENISVQPRDGKVILNWTEPRYSLFEPFSHIYIYRGEDEGNLSLYEQVEAGVRGMEDENVTNQEEYIYSFQASNDENVSVVSKNYEAVPDGTPPEIEDFYPRGEGVPVDSNIIVSFSEEMMEDSVDIEIEGVDGEVVGQGTIYRFIPEENFSYGESYEVLITGKDFAMNRLEERRVLITTSETTVRGQIYSTDDEPLSDVIVQSDDSFGNYTRVRSDEEGNFTLIIDSQVEKLLFRKEGYVEKEIEVDLDPSREKNIGPIEMEEERSRWVFTRWVWPLVISSVVVMVLGLLAFFNIFQNLGKSEIPIEEEEELIEEHYEEISQEEFDEWWDEGEEKDFKKY